MELKSFYTVKETLMRLLDDWLDEREIKKIEIIPVRIDEFITFIYREDNNK